MNNADLYNFSVSDQSRVAEIVRKSIDNGTIQSLEEKVSRDNGVRVMTVTIVENTKKTDYANLYAGHRVLDIVPRIDTSSIYDAMMKSVAGKMTDEIARMNFMSQFKEVVYNPPATIVFWKDGSKTVVKAMRGEEFDPEKGLAMAYLKHSCTNDNWYHKLFKKFKFTPPEPKKPKKKTPVEKKPVKRATKKSTNIIKEEH